MCQGCFQACLRYITSIFRFIGKPMDIYRIHKKQTITWFIIVLDISQVSTWYLLPRISSTRRFQRPWFRAMLIHQTSLSARHSSWLPACIDSLPSHLFGRISTLESSATHRICLGRTKCLRLCTSSPSAQAQREHIRKVQYINYCWEKCNIDIIITRQAVWPFSSN